MSTPNVEQREEKLSKTRSDSLQALVAGLTGALLTLAGQYLITYKSIEEPKLALETKKVDIEAYKLGLALLPLVEATCVSKRIDDTVWRASCRLLNKGQYPAVAHLVEVGLYPVDDAVGFPLLAGNHLFVQVANFRETFGKDSRAFDIPLGTAGRDIGFLVKPSDVGSAAFVKRPQIVLKIAFEFQTIEAPVRFLRTRFPESSEMLASLSKSATPVIVLAQPIP
jgi:hypothetical protein